MFTCIGNNTVEFFWRFQNETISSSDRRYVLSVIGSMSQLIVMAVDANTAGEYQCGIVGPYSQRTRLSQPAVLRYSGMSPNTTKKVDYQSHSLYKKLKVCTHAENIGTQTPRVYNSRQSQETTPDDRYYDA